jgi:hypothetical protein
MGRNARLWDFKGVYYVEFWKGKNGYCVGFRMWIGKVCNAIV